MSRTLRYFGLVGLVFAAWLVLAQEFGWVSEAFGERWFGLSLKVGLGLFLGGLLLGLLSPVERAMRGGRCARCGTAVGRGQTYCADHLQATVNEYRDQMRRAEQRNRG